MVRKEDVMSVVANPQNIPDVRVVAVRRTVRWSVTASFAGLAAARGASVVRGPTHGIPCRQSHGISLFTIH